MEDVFCGEAPAKAGQLHSSAFQAVPALAILYKCLHICSFPSQIPLSGWHRQLDYQDVLTKYFCTVFFM